MTEWQPIETAPMDGSMVLLYGPKQMIPNVGIKEKYLIITDRFSHPDNKNGSYRGYIGWGKFNEGYWPATHWMPLPQPPTEQ